MPGKGIHKEAYSELSRWIVRKAVHRALRLWYRPTREGFEIFTEMLVSHDYGLKNDLSIIDSRIAINDMLTAFIEQLSKLQPLLAEVLTLRFKEKKETKEIAYRLNVSEDQVNRYQRTGIIYITGLLYDEEIRQIARFPKI